MEQLVGHSAKQRGDLNETVHVNPRSTPADGIDTRQVPRRPLERLHDLSKMPLRIGVRLRVPRRLLAEHGLAVDHRSHLAVTCPEIESDAATLKMPAQRG